MEYYAHTSSLTHTKSTKFDCDKSNWQLLSDHLNNVADLSEHFAEAFNMGSIGRLAGLLHDYGKASAAFQNRLCGSHAFADHKTAGAEFARTHYGLMPGKFLKYCILGHHNEIPNGSDQSVRLDHEIVSDINITDLIGELPAFSLPDWKFESKEECSVFQYTLIHMIYSALVDADYLDTEKFVTPKSFEKRGDSHTAEELFKPFELKLSELLDTTSEKSRTPVNKLRRKILIECIEAGKKDRSFYTLTVPTGGGKTFSSLAFSLEQAKTHAMNRIIVAVPFTTVTGQTANIFRSVFGEDFVLEHHSNIDISQKNDDERDIIRLKSQNWDSPLIVTTTVQLLESLFSNKPSKNRKLHNIANSVIIFDEAQSLPDNLLLPTLEVLSCLVRFFGCTVLFCTATQPAVDPFMGNIKTKEIIGNTDELFNALRRVEITNIGTKSDEEICGKLRSEHQALIVVNTRRHASALYEKLAKEDEVFHLSALMCPAHRKIVLETVKRKLANGERCILISTNLIEAGVDIDFPIVYRAAAGLESIAQSAGRCNREGKLENLGKFFLFTPEKTEEIPDYMKRNVQFGKETLNVFGDDPLSPEAIKKYFTLRFSDKKSLDSEQILTGIFEGGKKAEFEFSTIAKKYKLIKDDTYSVIIPFDDYAEKLLEEPLKHLRELQLYTVSVYEKDLPNLPITNIIDKIYKLDCPSKEQFDDAYSEKNGLHTSLQLCMY
jgi:CRISPR-associated helicase Cas3/CRISPR-associated endonuclease Cas3-HD